MVSAVWSPHFHIILFLHCGGGWSLENMLGQQSPAMVKALLSLLIKKKLAISKPESQSLIPVSAEWQASRSFNVRSSRKWFCKILVVSSWTHKLYAMSHTMSSDSCKQISIACTSRSVFSLSHSLYRVIYPRICMLHSSWRSGVKDNFIIESIDKRSKLKDELQSPGGYCWAFHSLRF